MQLRWWDEANAFVVLFLISRLNKPDFIPLNFLLLLNFLFYYFNDDLESTKVFSAFFLFRHGVCCAIKQFSFALKRLRARKSHHQKWNNGWLHSLPSTFLPFPCPRQTSKAKQVEFSFSSFMITIFLNHDHYDGWEWGAKMKMKMKKTTQRTFHHWQANLFGVWEKDLYTAKCHSMLSKLSFVLLDWSTVKSERYEA